jgi:hypothetical protein
VAFASGQYLALDPIDFPTALSVYVRARWASLPASNQDLICADDNWNTGSKKFFHLKGINTGIVQGASFRPDGVSASANGPTATVNTWQTVSMVIAATQITTYLDGTAGTPATIFSPFQNVGKGHLSIGSRYYNSSSEPLVGFIREIRVYGVTHDAPTVVAVVAAMNV